MNRPYHVSVLAPAARDLARMDKPIAQRIVRRLEWLASNLDDIHPEALKGTLSDFFKLRIGDYRVVYEIIKDERQIIIHCIGHRREIYR